MVASCSYAPEVSTNFKSYDLSSFHVEEGYSETELREYRKKQEEDPRELSGRSRGTLKKHFSETPVFDLPVGHPTIAFTEPQLYHLLRVISDETVSASWGLLKNLILQAAGLRGTTTGTGSRTDHFRKRGRSSTPARQDLPRRNSDTDSHVSLVQQTHSSPLPPVTQDGVPPLHDRTYGRTVTLIAMYH